MFIAIVLVASIGCWYQFGLFWAVGFVLLCGLARLAVFRISPIPLALLSIVTISGLELQMSHPLAVEYKHQPFQMTVCINQPIKQYDDDYLTGTARVIAQPEFLKLRQIKLAVNSENLSGQLQPGDCLIGQFRLRQPLGRLVPGAFDSDKYYFSEHIDALATLVSVNQIYSSPSLAQKTYLSRQAMFAKDSALQVWSALALGWSTTIDYSLKQLLSANQLMHLFVISGMHIGFISLTVFGFLFFVGLLLQRWYVLGFRLKATVTLIIVSGYVGFLGFPVPAVRALLMAGLPLLTFLFASRLPWYSGLAGASILMALVSPESWLSIGTWLSFSSVLLIQLIVRWRVLDHFHRSLKLILFQMVMSVSVIPWAAFLGFVINPLAWLINLLVSPLLAFLIMPVALWLLVWPMPTLASAFAMLIESLVIGLQWSAVFSVELPAYPTIVITIVILTFALAVWLRHSILQLVVLLFGVLAVGFMAVTRQFDTTDARLVVYDVGHGQAILISNDQEHWLYDTAGAIGEDLSVAELYLARALPELTGVIVSHSDSDHASGYAYLRRRFPAAAVWSGQPERIPNSRSCHEQRSITVHLRFIPIPTSLQTDDNNHSCVLLYERFGKRILITGDADKQIEYYLLQYHSYLFPLHVVVLGHHGSGSSSAEDWLEINRGAYYLVSNGDRARPVWPARRIVKWFSRAGERFHTTSAVGSITIELTPERIKLQTFEPAYRNRLIY